MGGDNQAQAHAQVVANFVDFGMHVQEAGEPPACATWAASSRSKAASAPRSARRSKRKGHASSTAAAPMGGYQAIMIDPETGVLLGGSDLRKDGLAIGW